MAGLDFLVRATRVRTTEGRLRGEVEFHCFRVGVVGVGRQQQAVTAILQIRRWPAVGRKLATYLRQLRLAKDVRAWWSALLFLTLLVFSTFQTLFYVRFTLRGLDCLDKALAFAAFACAFVTGVLSCVLYIIYWLNYMFEV